MKSFENTLIQITHYGMGYGDDELGLQLMSNYFKLIIEQKKLPKFIALYNSGVEIVCTGSPLIDILKTLESNGVNLVACKTCLNKFHLIDKMEVGIAGTMMDIIELQTIADKVINL